VGFFAVDQIIRETVSAIGPTTLLNVDRHSESRITNEPISLQFPSRPQKTNPVAAILAWRISN
jgi:hypothetical protein